MILSFISITMKVAVVLIAFCALVSVDAAPGKRFIKGLNIVGFKPCLSDVVCNISRCLMQTCEKHPKATCSDGCGCSAVWTDVNGNRVSC